MKKLIIIIFLLLGTAYAESAYAQSGGRKREKRVKTKKRGNSILTQYKSHGHADDFARNSTGRRGAIGRLFHRTQPSWTNRTSGSVRSQNRANRYLFKRERAKGHVENSEYLNRQSSERSKRRDHGNRSFKRKKYSRK